MLGDRRGLMTYAGDALLPILMPTGAPPAGCVPGTPLDARRIEPGRRTVAGVWVTLDANAAVPAALAHRIVVAGHALETRAVAVDTRPAIDPSAGSLAPRANELPGQNAAVIFP